MEISLHSVDNTQQTTFDTVGGCDKLVHYLVMHAHMKLIVQLTTVGST